MRLHLKSSSRRFRQFLEVYRRGARLFGSGTDQGAPGASADPEGRWPRYRALLTPRRSALVGIFALAVIGIAIDMVWPLAMAYLVDRVILGSTLTSSEKVARLIAVASVMLVLFFTNAGLNWIRALRIQLLTSRIAFDLRSRLFQRVLRLPLSEINQMKTGGILSRLSGDVESTTGLLQQALISPLLSLLRLTVTIGIIFVLNYKIATLVLLSVPPVMLSQGLRARRMRSIWRSMGQDRQEIDGRVSEGLTGVRIVRGFGREKREERVYTHGHHTVIRKQMLAVRTQRNIQTVWELVTPLAQLTILCFGGYLVIQGQTTLGTLVAFQGYIWRLLEPVTQLAQSISQTQRGLASMERVFELLDKEEDKPDLPDAVPAPRRLEEVRFEHVSFGYRPDVTVLHDFDLRIPGGTVLALVGPSGAGKSTVADLAARFLDPTSGVVRVNGIDLRKLVLKSYRRLLGIVSQEVFLFDGSVADNIAYARPSASADEIRDAARRANADGFIEALPEGYETLIGERGVKLSGGQRQRLSIARALLADPELLILDEATSNLDTESEQLIQASMQELLKDRTTLMIAHRLSTVTRAHRIVVLDAGRILESGTHEELMRARGVYSSMVERQRQEPPDQPVRNAGSPPRPGVSGEAGDGELELDPELVRAG